MKLIRLAIATFAVLLISALIPDAQAQPVSECDSPHVGAAAECLRTKTAVASIEIRVVLEAHRSTLKKQSQSTNSDEKVAGVEFDRRLTASQSAWEAYIRADCTLQSAEFYGGAYAPLAFDSCVLDQTEERLTYLKAARF